MMGFLCSSHGMEAGMESRLSGNFRACKAKLFIVLPATAWLFFSWWLPKSASGLSINGKFEVFGNLGYCMYAMTDINREINFINQAGMPAGGQSIDQINGGFTSGGGCAYAVMENLQLGVELGYLAAQTGYDSASGTNGGGYSPYTRRPLANGRYYHLYLPALEAGILVKGVWPISDMILLSLGGGMDYVYLYGRKNTEVADLTFAGYALGYKFLAGAQYFLDNWISLGVDVGYRLAKVRQIKDADGNTLKTAFDPGADAAVDYSGMIMHGGIHVYF